MRLTVTHFEDLVHPAEIRQHSVGPELLRAPARQLALLFVRECHPVLHGLAGRLRSARGVILPPPLREPREKTKTRQDALRKIEQARFPRKQMDFREQSE